MDTILPIALAGLAFPFSFLAARRRARRTGYVLPALLAIPFLLALVLGSGPAYANAFFAILALGAAWRWRTHREE